MSHSGPRISVAIATFNEGPDLEATISLVYASRYSPHEVIVCDDNSKEDPGRRLSSWINRTDFKYMRHTRRMGSGPTKQRALEAATGDLLIVLDSHMRPHWEWLNQIAKAHMTHPNDFLCTESVGFRQYGMPGTFYGRGAFFDPANSYKHGAHTVSWQPSEKLDAEPYPRIPAMHGGCYIFPAYQLKMIGGYAPALRGWGYEEEWIAMRSTMLGIETRLISGCPIAHQYERSLTREPATKEVRPQGWEPIYNRHAVAIGAFGWERWDGLYRKEIESNSDPAMGPHVREVIEETREEIQGIADYLQARRMPETEWMHRLGITHPAPGQTGQKPGKDGPQATPAPQTPTEAPTTPEPRRIDPRGFQGPTVVG